MKIVIFSDVHGNLEALEAVVGHVSDQDIGLFLCLGDVIGYGANPNECIEAVQNLGQWVCLKGNHDAAVSDPQQRAFFHEVALEGIRFTERQLTEANRAFLEDLPYTYLEHPQLMGVHASPYRPETWEYVLDQAGADRAFEAMSPHRVAFIGHSHSPVIFSDNGAVERFVPSSPVALDVETSRYVLNVGSVGQPRDGNPDASYVVYDDDTSRAELFRVQYDREKAADKILRAGLPPILAERLLVGY